ncbi:hypothetical protein [Rhizobium tubonense]|uniref:Uncharacterized protein n=1 Tax=Rhizobium tubonense TaxID=484088 RepID=A0A2W4CVG4_9HYPH|nr:hypothetical protein [Rhizobium tubonense]PZM14828.1 hypothetical protein CPY51_08945 [Rhizobium tubonense]
MANSEGDTDGSDRKATQYDGQGHRGARSGKVRSAWAVAIAGIFLIGLSAWIVLRPHAATDAAPGGSMGKRLTTTAPASETPDK